MHSFPVLGIPKQLKTDNGPGYTSTTFKQFCATFGITHVTGIPYNPQGQSIVERAHLTIKNTLFKQKGGIGDTFRSPRDKLSTILYILNFLNVDKNQHTAAERHWCTLGNSQPKVLWRDLLSGQWKGPDQVLIWSRGSVCVFPENAPSTIWVPEHLVKPVLHSAPKEAEAQKDDSHGDDNLDDDDPRTPDHDIRTDPLGHC